MSLLALLQTGCLIAFALLLLMAAWQDWRTMRIADGLSLGIVGAFAVWALGGLAGGTLSLFNLGLAVACALAMFGAGAVAFASGALGGGDVKLAAASTLFAGPALTLDFVMVTALVGGVLGLLLLAGAPIGPLAERATPTSTPTPTGSSTLRARLHSGLPYGPAIAVGGWCVAATLALT
jgi:prepilin peptidase CpaA